MARGRPKKNKDAIEALFRLVYKGPDAVPFENPIEDVEMPPEERWQRIYDVEWGNIEPNTKKTATTQLFHWLSYIDERNEKQVAADEEAGTSNFVPVDGVVHPYSKVARFLDWLNDRMVAMKSKDPQGTVESARKALFRVRKCQKGIPNPDDFVSNALLKSSWVKARQATALARTGEDADPMAGGFSGSTLSGDEIEKLTDASMRRGNFFIGARVAFMLTGGTAAGYRGDDIMDLKYSIIAMPTLVVAKPVPMQIVNIGLNGGKTNKECWLQYSGFGRHVHAHLDAQGYLGDIIFHDLNVNSLSIIEMMEQGNKQWRSHRILYRLRSKAREKQVYYDIESMFTSVTDMVDEVTKTKRLHLFRNSGVILLAAGGAALDVMKIWGRWVNGTMGQSYLEKNPLVAIQAYAILAGFGTDFMNKHYLGRALVAVPMEWVDAIAPEVRRVLDIVVRRNKAGKAARGLDESDGGGSDFSAEACLRTILYLAEVFFQNLPFKMDRYGSTYELSNLEAVKRILATSRYQEFEALVRKTHEKHMALMNNPAGSFGPELGQMLVKIQSSIDALGPASSSTSSAPTASISVAAGQDDMATLGSTAPPLFSRSINTVEDAWREWKYGINGFPSVCGAIEKHKNKRVKLGKANTDALAKKRALVQAIEGMVAGGAGGVSEEVAISKFKRLQDRFGLSLAQLQGGMRMMESGKCEGSELIYTTTVTVGEFMDAFMDV
jgi:hypothetical protein